MKSVFYDTETTGLPVWSIPSEDPSQPHIVQLAAILCDDDTGQECGTLNVIVRPDGWTIPDETIAVHGITMERAMDEGTPEKDATELFLDLLKTLPGCMLAAQDYVNPGYFTFDGGRGSIMPARRPQK